MSVLVGKQAPAFQASAVVGKEIIADFTLAQFKGKFVVLFFYPLDFTFVCPTELHAFQDHLAEFKKRGAELIACSIDSPYCHLAWLQLPKKRGGIEGVKYPIVSDINKTIATDYGVLSAQDGVALRGLFLIDKQGIVRHQVVNDLPIGRSVEEILRVIDALSHHEEHGEVCPANWQAGRKALKPTAEALESYFS